MGRALDFSDSAIAEAPRSIEEAFAIVEAELKARGTPFLGGAAPNAIDIIFSALVAPLTLPHGYGSKLPALDALPPELRRFVDGLRARRGGQLVFDTYAAARGLPQPPLKRPRRDRTLAQRLLGPATFRLAARAAVAFGAPIVVKRLALVSRWNDVQQVLENDLAYRIEPINGPNFHTISGAFVLGLDRGPQFARERRQMYDAVSRIDAEELRARIRDEADRIITAALSPGIASTSRTATPIRLRPAAPHTSLAFPDRPRQTSCASAGRFSISAFSQVQRDAGDRARTPCRGRDPRLDDR